MKMKGILAKSFMDFDLVILSGAMLQFGMEYANIIELVMGLYLEIDLKN